jgi:hypothetical protein
MHAGFDDWITVLDSLPTIPDVLRRHVRLVPDVAGAKTIRRASFCLLQHMWDITEEYLAVELH